MMPRFFRVYTDRKTVKQISWEEWSKIAELDRNHEQNNTHMICRIDKTSLWLRKGRQSIWVDIRQLKEILKNDS